MAVPDWPTTNSYWFYPITLWLAVWDVFLEHGHRLLAQLAGLLAITLAVSLWLSDGRKWMRWVGAAIVLGVVAQGTLGGLRVLADDRVLARVHGCTAALYFALCAAVVTWTSTKWRATLQGAEPHSPPAPLPKVDGSHLLSRLAWIVTAAIYLEIIFGALLRRPSAEAAFAGANLPGWMKTLCMDQVATWFELLVWLKVINAGLIAVGVVWLWVAERRPAGPRASLAGRAWWLAAIVSVQLVLAGATWVTNYGWPTWFTQWIWPLQSSILAQGRLLVLLTTAHAAVGSLALIAALNLAMWSTRCCRALSSESQPTSDPS